MNVAMSDRRVFAVLCKTWPMFNRYASLRHVFLAGWTTNVFYDNDIPYIWRSNCRIAEERLWRVLEVVFADLYEHDEVYMFHDRHAGWKSVEGEIGNNGVALHGIHEALEFMKRFSFYSRKQWNYGEKNDNYNMVLEQTRAFVSFTHHGEVICFAEDVQWLKLVAHRFKTSRLVCNIYEQRVGTLAISAHSSRRSTS